MKTSSFRSAVIHKIPAAFSERCAITYCDGPGYAWLFLLFLSVAFPMHAQSDSSTLLLETATYRVLFQPGDIPRLFVQADGHRLLRLPVVSGLSISGHEEILTTIKYSGVTTTANGAQQIIVTAKSSLWASRRFIWSFFSDHIEFQQFAKGDKPIKRCYFFSNGISAFSGNGTSQGISSNTIIDADRYFSPSPNHTDQLDHPIVMSQTVGVGPDPYTMQTDNASASRLFSPPPLMLAFARRDTWVSLGIGTSPGGYRFNALEYSGSRFAGASFWVDYQGREPAAAGFSSPIVAFHFGSTSRQVLTRYVAWLDSNGFSTIHRFPNAAWHHLPIFCGWGEQTVEAVARSGTSPESATEHAGDYATQANYEKWIDVLHQRGLPVGTIVIDAKWQKAFGTLEIDKTKWPDMKGFIARQHALGRHILLWTPVAFAEGLPPSLTILQNGKPALADVSNPLFVAYFRRQIKHLVVDIRVDGFKEDLIEPLIDFSTTKQAQPLYGIEFIRRFQFILYDETHKWRPDALVETQTPNPLFRESSDVIRLNDIYYAARNIPGMMRRRAQIAWAAGWQLVDTDNASNATLDEWWSYMRAQPSIGIPSLYFVSATETTHEEPPADYWKELTDIWKRYLAVIPK